MDCEGCCVGCREAVGEGETGVLADVAVAGLDVGVAVTPIVGAGEAGKGVVVV